MEEQRTLCQTIVAYAPYSYILIVLSIAILAMIIQFIMISSRSGAEEDSDKEDKDGS